MVVWKKLLIIIAGFLLVMAALIITVNVLNHKEPSAGTAGYESSMQNENSHSEENLSADNGSQDISELMPQIHDKTATRKIECGHFVDYLNEQLLSGSTDEIFSILNMDYLSSLNYGIDRAVFDRDMLSLTPDETYCFYMNKVVLYDDREDSILPDAEIYITIAPLLNMAADITYNMEESRVVVFYVFFDTDGRIYSFSPKEVNAENFGCYTLR